MNNVTSDQHDEKQPSSENWNESLQRTKLGHFFRGECENMRFSPHSENLLSCNTWPCACFFISFLYIVFSLKKVYKSKKTLQVVSIWYYRYVWNSMLFYACSRFVYQSIPDVFLLYLKRNHSQTFKSGSSKSSSLRCVCYWCNLLRRMFLFYVITRRHYFS